MRLELQAQRSQPGRSGLRLLCHGKGWHILGGLPPAHKTEPSGPASLDTRSELPIRMSFKTACDMQPLRIP